MSLVTFPRQFLVDANGLPRVGAKANFYQSGTTTRITTYTTGAYAVEHANPVLSVSGSGFFPAVYVNPSVNATFKMVITDSADVTLYTEDNIPALGFAADDIGGILYPLTTTETLSSAEPETLIKQSIPMDWERYDDGAANKAVSINAALAAMNAGSIAGGALVLPGDANTTINIATSIDVPKRASGDNHSNWLSLRGMGRGSPRVTAGSGMANEPMIDASGVDSSTYSFYREVKDLYLNGAGIAQKGIDIRYNQHFRLDNLFITGLANGSGTAAGVEMFGAICAEILGVKVHNCQGHGFYMSGGSGNFWNANAMHGCSVLDVTGSGMYFTGGCAGSDISGCTFEFCDEYGLRFAGFSTGGTHIHGNYLESNVLGDIYLGEDTSQECTTVEANYLNGYSAGIGASDYTPIKIKFGNGLRIIGNQVATTPKSPTGFLILDANISGGGVSNCIVEDNQVADLSSSTAPNTIYNLPTTWVNFGNRLIDPRFAPLIRNNLLGGGRLPYGGWSISVSGTGTVVRGADMLGAPAVKMDRPAASTASFSRVLTISEEAKNRFVTFAVPVRELSGSSGAITVSVTPNGTSPQTGTISTDSLTTDEETIIYVLAFVPSDATTITVEVSLAATGGSFLVGHPCLYVGAQQWYSADGDADWRATAAPTTGTWATGDKVWDSTPASGQPIGWGCSAGGTPGTWIAMANYA